jgi:hypothetical protein
MKKRLWWIRGKWRFLSSFLDLAESKKKKYNHRLCFHSQIQPYGGVFRNDSLCKCSYLFLVARIARGLYDDISPFDIATGMQQHLHTTYENFLKHTPVLFIQPQYGTAGPSYHPLFHAVRRVQMLCTPYEHISERFLVYRGGCLFS